MFAGFCSSSLSVPGTHHQVKCFSGAIVSAVVTCEPAVMSFTREASSLTLSLVEHKVIANHAGWFCGVAVVISATDAVSSWCVHVGAGRFGPLFLWGWDSDTGPSRLRFSSCSSVTPRSLSMLHSPVRDRPSTWPRSPFLYATAPDPLGPEEKCPMGVRQTSTLRPLSLRSSFQCVLFLPVELVCFFRVLSRSCQ